MRIRPALLAILLLAAAATSDAAAKKARRSAGFPVPRVTPAMRVAAIDSIGKSLEHSAASAISNPEALIPAFELLLRGHAATPPEPFHILHFGDSHTAADEWTGRLRDLLKENFGDGGSGFSLAGHPFAGYRRFDARGGATTSWSTAGLRSANGDGYFGLGGVSIASWRAGESVFLETECDRLEVHYLQQPLGGDVELLEDGRAVQQFSTRGDLAPGAFEYRPASAGPHRFTLRTLNANPVRLFGWVADRGAGVTYEALGINGAEAGVMLKWDEQMLAAYLQRRNPGLIVLAYGTNEASDPAWNAQSYRAMFSSLLQRLRAAVPPASILVVGPPDRWSRSKAGWRVVPGVDDIIEAQRAACAENRCAFWDTRRRMGDKGSMRNWLYAGMAQGDYVHFNATGYRRLGDVLYQDLLREFETYRKARPENMDQAIR
jgi:lysophospholipase L1-like esterase